MSAPAIRVVGLGKRYRIGGPEVHQTLSEAISLVLSFRHISRATPARQAVPHIWSLKDVSFEVDEGEVVGVIGRNGAGKSTLLKILSQITEPTEGRAEVRGRVRALLEVGTGFHPELTGRENIFLNGAILGMKRAEISRRFEEIVAFAGVDQFLDTPVKHYSSGMYVRLAFSVAAHLEPEILLIDEVLAVGDAGFQRKCLGRISKVSRAGRTVFFVSHSMPAILHLCSRVILLDGGRIEADGPAQAIVHRYMASLSADQSAEVSYPPANAPGDTTARLRGIRLRGEGGGVSTQHRLSDPVWLDVDFECLEPGHRLNVALHLYDSVGTPVFAANNYREPEWGARTYARGRYRSTCVVPGNLLNAGVYRVSIVLVRDARENVARVEEAVSFEVVDDGSSGSDYLGGYLGVIRPSLPWVTTERDEKWSLLGDSKR